MKKMTNKNMYEAMISYLQTGEMPEGMTIESMVGFCESRIAQLEKKSGGERKPTAKQIENEGYKATILNILRNEDRPMRIVEIQAADPTIAELHNQRISHLLRQLILAGDVVKTYIKKQAHFSAVS